MYPLFQGAGSSRNAYGTNQGTNEDDSQSDPHPEAGIFHNQMTRNSDPEDGHDKLQHCRFENLIIMVITAHHRILIVL